MVGDLRSAPEDTTATGEGKKLSPLQATGTEIILASPTISNLV